VIEFTDEPSNHFVVDEYGRHRVRTIEDAVHRRVDGFLLQLHVWRHVGVQKTEHGIQTVPQGEGDFGVGGFCNDPHVAEVLANDCMFASNQILDCLQRAQQGIHGDQHAAPGAVFDGLDQLWFHDDGTCRAFGDAHAATLAVVVVEGEALPRAELDHRVVRADAHLDRVGFCRK
jgi:hypothetical protein